MPVDLDDIVFGPVPVVGENVIKLVPLVVKPVVKPVVLCPDVFGWPDVFGALVDLDDIVFRDDLVDPVPGWPVDRDDIVFGPVPVVGET